MCKQCQAINPNYCICMFCNQEFDKCTCDNVLSNRTEILDDIDDSYTDALEEND